MLTKLGQRGYTIHEESDDYRGLRNDTDADSDSDPEAEAAGKSATRRFTERGAAASATLSLAKPHRRGRNRNQIGNQMCSALPSITWVGPHRGHADETRPYRMISARYRLASDFQEAEARRNRNGSPNAAPPQLCVSANRVASTQGRNRIERMVMGFGERLDVSCASIDYVGWTASWPC